MIAMTSVASASSPRAAASASEARDEAPPAVLLVNDTVGADPLLPVAPAEEDADGGSRVAVVSTLGIAPELPDAEGGRPGVVDPLPEVPDAADAPVGDDPADDGSVDNGPAVVRPSAAFPATDAGSSVAESIARQLHAGGHTVVVSDLGDAIMAAPGGYGASPSTIPAELLSVPETAVPDGEYAPAGVLVERFATAGGEKSGEAVIASASTHVGDGVTRLTTTVTLPSDGNVSFAVEGSEAASLTINGALVDGAPIAGTAGETVELVAEDVVAADAESTLSVSWSAETEYVAEAVTDAASVASSVDTVIVVIEGALPVDHAQLLSALATANPRTAVVLDAYADPSLGAWLPLVHAVLHVPQGAVDAATVIDGSTPPRGALESAIVRTIPADDEHDAVEEILFAAGHGLSFLTAEEPVAAPQEPAAPITQDAPVSASSRVLQTQSPPALRLSLPQGEVLLASPTRLNDRMHLSGALPPVTVIDERGDPSAAQGWTLAAQVSDLSGARGTLSAAQLGWAPRLVSGYGATAGPAISGELSGGPGLSGTAVLGSGNSAPRSHPTQIGADLVLETSLDAPPGIYRGTITVTLFPSE